MPPWRNDGSDAAFHGEYREIAPDERTRSDPQELEFARLWKAIPKVVFSAMRQSGAKCPDRRRM